MSDQNKKSVLWLFNYDDNGTWRPQENAEYGIDSRPDQDRGFTHKAYHLSGTLYEGPDFQAAKLACQSHAEQHAGQQKGEATTAMRFGMDDRSNQTFAGKTLRRQGGDSIFANDEITNAYNACLARAVAAATAERDICISQLNDRISDLERQLAETKKLDDVFGKLTAAKVGDKLTLADGVTEVVLVDAAKPKGGRWTIGARSSGFYQLYLDGKRPSIPTDVKSIFDGWTHTVALAAADFLNSVTQPAAAQPAASEGPYTVRFDSTDTLYPWDVMNGTQHNGSYATEAEALDDAWLRNFAHAQRTGGTK